MNEHSPCDNQMARCEAEPTRKRPTGGACEQQFVAEMRRRPDLSKDRTAIHPDAEVLRVPFRVVPISVRHGRPLQLGL